MRSFKLIPGLLLLALSSAQAEDTPFSVARDTINQRNAAINGGGRQPIGGDLGGAPLQTGRYIGGEPAGRGGPDTFRAGVPAVPMGETRGSIAAGGNIQYRQNFSMDGVGRRRDGETPTNSEVNVSGGMMTITLNPEAARSFENRIAPGGLTVGVTVPTRYAGNPNALAGLQSSFVRIRPENVERVGDGLVITVAAPPGVAEGPVRTARITGGSDGPTRRDPDRAIQPTALTITNASAPVPVTRELRNTPRTPPPAERPLPPPEVSIGYNSSMSAANPVILTPPTPAVPAGPGVAARPALQPVVAFVPAVNVGGALPATGANIPMMATVRSPAGVVTTIPVTGALHPTNDFAAPGTAAISFNLPRGATLISARTVPPAATAPPLPAGFQHFSIDFNHQPALNTIAVTAMHTPPQP